MLFNSLEFLVFFPLVATIYFLLPHKFRAYLLLAASYFFYGYWKVEYLGLIVLSTLVDYFAGIGISSTKKKNVKKVFLLSSLTINLGLLFIFKYFNFVNDSLQTAFGYVGVNYSYTALNVLLPIGISFYTFQTISYTIDVYRGKVKPERNLWIFALYVSFFPQLVAGPIERASRLIPQFYKEMDFDWDRIRSGLILVLWGFFKKIVIADRVGIYVDQVYSQPSEYSGIQLVIASYFFAYQIYCDFSGYTDIARGTARVLGFDLMENFRRPTVVRSANEFWQSWHISLTKWMMDYVYYPLARKFRTPVQRAFVVLFVFFLIGAWHGAAWNFIFFGIYSGIVLIFGQATRPLRNKISERIFPKDSPKAQTVYKYVQYFIGLNVFVVGAMFFRSSSSQNIYYLFTGIFKNWSFTAQNIFVYKFEAYELTIAIFAIIALELGERFRQYYNAEEEILKLSLPKRWAVYYLMIFVVVLFGEYGVTPFIYFQF